MKDRTGRFSLIAEQHEFMGHYEKWMDKFIPAVKAQHENPEDNNAKATIVELSEEVDNRRSQ